MDLTDGKWIHGGSQADVVRVISDGVRGTAMVAYRDQLTPKQIAALARLVRSFDKAAKANRAGPDSGRGGPLTAGARWD
jgi:mono/diheme cytochrome c family protein